MPSAMHNEASAFWFQNVAFALVALVPNGRHLSMAPGCKFVGKRSMFFQA
jgi:hypothetical protein